VFLYFFIDVLQSFHEGWMTMIECRVEWISHERSLIPLEQTYEGVLQWLPMVVDNTKLVSLILGPPNQRHGQESGQKVNWHVEL
jgi:hypothetical protein